MKRQTVTINGETFELFKSKLNETESFTNGAVYDAIYDAYSRPSYIKVGIWHDWCNWCYDLNNSGNDCELWIASHNCMTFSIGGKVKFEGHVYDLWITKCHRRAYLIA